ncbi:MAG: NfeD family protein [Hyphomicrobiales bacterium]
MFEKLIVELGPWSWWVVGFILLALEIVVPGVFFLWLGFAAVITGTIALIAPMGWAAQFAIFAGLSLVLAIAGRRFYAGNSTPEDNEGLNERGRQFIGQTFTLVDDMVGGQGRVKIGDTYWIVKGQENKTAGSEVNIVGVDSSVLKI